MKLLFALFLFGSSASAFTLNSTNNSNFRGWGNPKIDLVINNANCPAGVDVTSVIQSAIKIWNNVSTSDLKLSIVGTTTSTTYSTPATVYCETNYGSVVGDANSSPGAASILPSGDYAAGGVIILNASSGTANIANISPTVLSIVLAHEVGHLVGLGHSQDLNALMYYDASAKTTLALAQDDIDGISYLYPRNELGTNKPLGCARVSSNSSPSNPAQMILFLLLPLVLLWSRWRTKIIPSH